MPEEIKEKILKHFEITPDEKYSIRQLHSIIGEASYPTILKWTLILQAEGKLKIEDYGSVKVVSLNKDIQEKENG